MFCVPVKCTDSTREYVRRRHIRIVDIVSLKVDDKTVFDYKDEPHDQVNDAEKLKVYIQLRGIEW